MKTMKKEFEYRVFNFTYTVGLNHIKQRGYDAIHLATITCGDRYDKSVKIFDRHLPAEIIKFEKQAKEWADDKIDGKSTPEGILKFMGFE